MSGTDSVTFADLEKHCMGNQSECARLRTSQGETQTMKIEAAIKTMAIEIAGYKIALDARLWVLPKPILYMLLAGAVCAGMAGNKAVEFAMKAFVV